MRYDLISRRIILLFTAKSSTHNDVIKYGPLLSNQTETDTKQLKEMTYPQSSLPVIGGEMARDSKRGYLLAARLSY